MKPVGLPYDSFLLRWKKNQDSRAQIAKQQACKMLNKCRSICIEICWSWRSHEPIREVSAEPPCSRGDKVISVCSGYVRNLFNPMQRRERTQMIFVIIIYGTGMNHLTGGGLQLDEFKLHGDTGRNDRAVPTHRSHRIVVSSRKNG